MQQLYTIGHSTHSALDFLTLLRQHGIEVIADVRSHPYSRRHPHFARERLRASLAEARIGYVFLGRALGARREEPECYVDDQARYDRIALLPTFAQGMNRLLSGAHHYRVALMCAEQDPLTCHRAILVCQELKKHGATSVHIHRDGSLEDAEASEWRLIREELGDPEQADLFARRGNAAATLEQALAQRAARIAYRRD